MGKKRIERKRALTVAFLCSGIIVWNGCGLEESASKDAETVEEEQAEQIQGEDTEAQAEETENPTLGEESVPDSADAKEEEKSDSEEENAEKPQTLQEAQIRHYYSGVLSQLIAAGQLPYLGEVHPLFEDRDMSTNLFAVTDIDGDGREELIVCYLNGGMAGTFEVVYGYDPIAGELKQEFCYYPTFTYYDNGIICASWSHNPRMAEFWPIDVYQYDSESDSYMTVGTVDTLEREICERWYGKPFPEELDTDGDGVLYRIDNTWSDEYEDYKYNQADFEEWFGVYTEGAMTISIDYQPIEYESFADFTPTYLKRLAHEAGRERTDTASDLGLLILNEAHFLDAAKTLLSEKYDVVMEQPEENFEEYTVGTVSGKEVFTFTALDAGDLSYSGEKLDDVTIFGIYPGISVDGAWEKLKAYGFYASPYGEVENCLITGEGFGNVSIWFSAEDGVVTEITVRPYCAFAG